MRQALFRNFVSAFVVVCFFCTTWISASGFPQATQGSVAIAGIVVDQNDAPVANAEVTVANEPSISARTDADGPLPFRFRSFVAVEDLFGQRYESGKTPLITLGPPTLVRAGFRFSRSSHR